MVNLDSDPERESRRVWGMLRDEGYFYLTGSEVSAATTEQLAAVARSFFDMSLSEKLRFHINKSSRHQGYYPTGEEGPAASTPDLKEGFDSGLFEIRRNRDGEIPSSQSLWPPIPGFRQEVEHYHSKMTSIAQGLSIVIAQAIGASDQFFLERAQDPPNQLRLLHYPASPTPRQGVGTHKDFECFTLLASTGPGLEVERPDGAWVEVPPLKGALVVTTGEMLEILTNGALLAARHKVGWIREERYSFPYFFSLDRHSLVEPLDQFIGDGGFHYSPVLAGEHLQTQTSKVFSYLREDGQTATAVPPKPRPLAT
ncbi:isopenicillin N synthase family dioxygenase [Streptomyces sp. AK02-01A]|uniref:isopenicillin N synthase family dioxygenase n=1 Tax=Streptomyces sp. AK02-01A TaxID=3028648 RepID=UPI0029B5A422|nr:2OG-Fe(II) oxygenase family protein [Streptomyces sp. AK02-01A]MDX3849711.1 2OG-Fe(II) oxygenase family protein [Streptomyces sp. AK02-01A]MDX3849719.1 2OG-Fe(II) oxygenase family protein [Streptomyces sp. AK02-01A]